MKKQPNLILFGIDSLRRDHMSLYGYHRLTTPHMDAYARRGSVFESTFSPSIPTTPGYSSMFTGMDVFGTDAVALRHIGPLGAHLTTLPEVLAAKGYNTTCVGFSKNAASRGFQKYIDFSGWGSWDEGRSHKAENLNAVAVPELKRLVSEDRPFFLFLRHMDPHSPYLPPAPFERLFYGGNETDPANRSLDPVYAFKPFVDYFRSWFPPECTDVNYVIAQYDAELAYMDACIGNLLRVVESLGIEEETLIVFDSDHGETLFDHDCYFDHHGMYECTLTIPLFFVQPGVVPAGVRVPDICQMKDIMPTVLELMGIDADIRFDGRSLVPRMHGKERATEPEMYITECTWMRKHGWRTPEWKLIEALEPDFHFKPQIELYNLIQDPGETQNVADKEPGVVAYLQKRMAKHIARRQKATGRTNPIMTNLDWHGKGVQFTSSQQAYDALHIGTPKQAKDLQAKEVQSKEIKTQRGAEKL